MKRYEIRTLHTETCSFTEFGKSCGIVADCELRESGGGSVGRYCYKHAQRVKRDFEQAELQRTRHERQD